MQAGLLLILVAVDSVPNLLVQYDVNGRPMNTPSYRIFLLFAVVFLIMVLPDLAFAVGPAPGHTHSNLGTQFCRWASWFTGNAGKGIACFGIIIIGTAALYGKISWPAAIIIGVGVAAIFGAQAILTKLGLLNCTATFS